MKAILLMVVLMALLMEILGASLNRPSEDEAEGRGFGLLALLLLPYFKKLVKQFFYGIANVWP